MTFWFLTNAWNYICRPGPCQPPVPPVQRPLGSLPHSCKNTLLVQVREILWATKQQVEVSTPATISSAIPPCSEDRSAPLSEETTCRVVLVASQASSDKKETIGAVTRTVIPPTPFPLIYSLTVGTSPMVIQTSPSLSSPTSQPLPWIYIIT